MGKIAPPEGQILRDMDSDGNEQQLDSEELFKISCNGQALRTQFVNLSQNLQHLCDVNSQLQNENFRLKSTVAETLEYSSKINEESESTASSFAKSTEECLDCVLAKAVLNQLRQEKQHLEYMKPYTQELLRKNEIATTRIRELEKKVSETEEMHSEHVRRSRSCMSKISQLTESVAIVQEQVRNCQRHQQQLLRKVYELETRNAEILVVNKHQKCIIKDNMATIELLRAELFKLMVGQHEDNQLNTD